MNIWPALEMRDLYKIRSIDIVGPYLFVFMCEVSGGGVPGMRYFLHNTDGDLQSMSTVKYGPGAKEMVL